MEPRLIAARLPRDGSAVAVAEAIWAAGDALLALDPDAPPAETERLLSGMRPHALIDGDTSVPLESPGPVAPGTALVIATSGTTGAPKGVVLGHAALEAAAAITNEALGATPGRRWLCCLPLHHIAGFMTLLRSRALGTDAVVHHRFEVAAFATETGAAFVSVVPTMLERLLEAGVDLTGFDRVLVGGAAIGDDLIARARATGARVTTTYGMTETCGGVVYDGVPLAGVGIDIDASGRISIASETLMSGYRNDPAATQSALVGGRLITQDRGTWDEHGRLRVLGRIDRVIVTGGKKVSAAEVEQALCAHPGVSAATVRGEPDPVWGEIVVATVVPTDPAAPPSEDELDSFLREHLSAHKLPRSYTFEVT